MRLLPRRRSRPNEETLLRLPFDETVYVVNAVPSDDTVAAEPLLEADQVPLSEYPLKESLSIAACMLVSSTPSSS